MMLAAVFLILMEGTVYGNSIARRPHHDTIGVAVGVLAEVLICLWLCAVFRDRRGGGAGGGQCGDVFVPHRDRAVLLPHHPQHPAHGRYPAFCWRWRPDGRGVVFYEHFCLKFAAVAAILFVYCTLYRPQLQKLWQLAMGPFAQAGGPPHTPAVKAFSPNKGEFHGRFDA